LRGSNIHVKMKVEFLSWIYWIYVFIVFPFYNTLFPTAGFSHRIYHRGFNEAIGTLCFSFSSFMPFLYVVRSCLHACCHGAQQEGKCCNISLVQLCHVIYVYSDFSLFLPFSLRQDNTHKTSSFHQTSIIILTHISKAKYCMVKSQKADSVVADSTKRLTSRFYQLKMGLVQIGQYLHWAKDRPDSAQCWRCKCPSQTRDHRFKVCPEWKVQQKV